MYIITLGSVLFLVQYIKTRLSYKYFLTKHFTLGIRILTEFENNEDNEHKHDFDTDNNTYNLLIPY